MRLAAGLALAGVAAALAPAVASAAPTLDGTFTPSTTPGHIALGPDGNLWFTLSPSLSTDKEFGRITPDGTITEFDTPGDLKVQGITSGPSALGGPHNRIWMTALNNVVEWDPAAGGGAGSGTAHPIAGLTGPRDIAADGQGNIWAVATDHVVKIKPDDGTKVNDFLAGSGGRGITLGGDGRMWLADFANNALKAFNIADPDNNPQSVATTVGPQEIEAGPANQLAVSLPADAMARVSTAGQLDPTTDMGSDATGVTFGADGAYWFASFPKDVLGRITPTGDYTKPITFPAGTGPRHIETGPDDTLWVTGETSGKIHRITGVSPPPTQGPGDGPPGGEPDTTVPGIASVKVSVRKLLVSLVLSEAAALVARVEVKRNGRRSGTKCKPLKKGQRTSKPCRYWKQARLLIEAGAPGKNTIEFGKKLNPGSYRAVIGAIDAAGNTAQQIAGFKIG